MPTETWNSPGTYTWTVPDGLYTVSAIVRGAQGGDGNSGGGSGDQGGRVEADVDVTPGETLYITVGEEGQQGGSSTIGGGGGVAGEIAGSGGGASDIRQNGNSLNDRILVGGGGGGGGGRDPERPESDTDPGRGGDGGGPTGSGEDGEDSYAYGTKRGEGGGGGTQNSGGTNPEANDGSFGEGGYGAQDGSTLTDDSGGGGGWYGGAAGYGGRYAGAGGGGGSGYADGSVCSNVSDAGQQYGDGAVDISYTEPVNTPNNVNATYVADDQINLSFDEDTSGGEVDNFSIQIRRDGGSFGSPAGGPSNTSSDGTYSYGPNSDTAYKRQIGIDSSFGFRVRAENSAGESDWSYSNKVYTTPVPPHNPSVSRSDAMTVELNWTTKTDIHDYTRIEYRVDTGSGYGAWKWLGNSFGDGTETWSPTDSVQSNTEIQEDARYQFRIRERRRGNDSGLLESEYVYMDYGNDGNVYFEDGFESGDKSAWDGYYSDNGTVVQNPSNSSAGISSSEEGDYSLRIRSNAKIRATLPDLSDESGVIVKCAVASGSINYDGEPSHINFWDGSTWQRLRTFNHEYNRQGWVEVTARVPDSYLGPDNYVRFGRNSGGGGDCYYVDRVIVSDVLDEYTSPAAPSGIGIDRSVENELTTTWTVNQASLPTSYQEYRERVTGSGGNLSKDGIEVTPSSYTAGQKPDGERYDIRVDALVRQHRHGTIESYPRAAGTMKTAVTRLPSATEVTVESTDPAAAGVSWMDNADNEDDYIVRARRRLNDRSGLAWHYQFRTGQQVTIPDLSGNGNTAEYRPEYTSARPETAEGYARCNDESATRYVAVNHGITTTPTQLSAGAWVATTHSGETIVISYDASEIFRLRFNANGQASVYVSTVDDGTIEISGSTALNDGDLHYIGFTFDAGDVDLYVDGGVVASTSLTDTRIGSGTDRYGFIGTGSESMVFDDVRGPNRGVSRVAEAWLWVGRALDAEHNTLYDYGHPMNADVVNAGANATDATVNGLLNGEEYLAAVDAVTEHGTARDT